MARKNTLTTWQHELAQLQAVIDRLLQGRLAINVLDAGCGWKGFTPYLRLPKQAYVVGIDVAEEELRKNTIAQEKIIGDIQTYPLPSETFDVIVCWWVLEHLSQPEKALQNLFQAMKDDGILILVVPNLFSFKGLVTKYTPLWFHSWYHRAILGAKDHSPFPTFLRFSISPWALKRFASRRSLSITHTTFYASDDPGGDNQLINQGLKRIRQVIRVLTLGKIDIGLTEFLVVLKKEKATITSAQSERELVTGLHPGG